MRLVRIIGLFLGLSGSSLMAVESAWAGAEEFPAEVRFLSQLPVLMKGTTCPNGQEAKLVRCEIRIQTAGRDSRRAIYIVVHMSKEGYFVSSATLIHHSALLPGRTSFPDDVEVIVSGVCENEFLNTTSPTPCDFVALRSDGGGEKFYLRLSASVPGGALFQVLPGKLIFPSSDLRFLYFQK